MYLSGCRGHYLCMHYLNELQTVGVGLYQLLPRDASAERGDATVSRLSVRLSVCNV